MKLDYQSLKRVKNVDYLYGSNLITTKEGKFLPISKSWAFHFGAETDATLYWLICYKEGKPFCSYLIPKGDIEGSRGGRTFLRIYENGDTFNQYLIEKD